MIQGRPGGESKSECLDQKQLAVLHELACQAEKAGATLDEIFRWTVDRIAQKHLQAVAAGARINLDGREYVSLKFAETPWKQTAEVVVQGKRLGVVEIWFEQNATSTTGESVENVQQVFVEEIAARLGRIIERFRVEDTLRESEERFQAILKASPVGLLLTRPADGTVIELSGRTANMSGHDPDDMKGKTTTDLGIIDAEHRALLLSRLQQEGFVRNFEVPARHKNGTLHFLSLSVNPVVLKGEALLLTGAVDITEIKRAGEERQKLQAQLFHAQKMESIGTLAGGIAHDFNNLLTGIMGNLSLMELDLGKDFAFFENIKEMEHLVERGADLTRQLLGFARRGKYEVKPLDLNTVVDETSKMFGRTRKDIVIHRDFSNGVAPVLADRTQIEQMLLNLLLNAGHAMSSGGELTLKTKILVLSAAEVALHGTAPGQYIQLLVGDTGVGMDEETRLRIFEPFFTTKGAGHGTGLGLPSVYGIITNHGGFITVDSEPGKGSTFVIHLPTTDRPIPREKDFPLAPRRGGETILVVDDEDQILVVCNRLLSSMGYNVLTARSGQEALEIFQKHQGRVSLIILDMIMPGTSGSQTLEALRQIAPSVKILLSSGFSIDGQAADLLARGCNGFLQKPFGASELSEKLKELL